MLIFYELYDKEGEPLMDLKGNKYIAPIGSNVIFSDDAREGEEVVCIEFVGKVISHQYNIELDTLYIDCETIHELTKKDESDLGKYYKIKEEC